MKKKEWEIIWKKKTEDNTEWSDKKRIKLEKEKKTWIRNKDNEVKKIR